MRASESTKDRTASEHTERVVQEIQERAGLISLDRQALARRESEDRRLQDAEQRQPYVIITGCRQVECYWRGPPSAPTRRGARSGALSRF